MNITKYSKNNSSFLPNVFDDFFQMLDHPFFTNTDSNKNGLLLNTDVFEANKQYNIVTEVPGLNKEDVQVTYDAENRFLTISVKSAYEKFEDKPNFYIRERSIGTNKRHFRIPGGVNASTLKTEMKDGILKIVADIQEKDTGNCLYNIEIN